MKKEQKRVVPIKNYVKAVLLLLFVVGVVLYARRIYLLNQDSDLSQSVLSRVVGEVKYEEIDNVFLEVNGNYFIYVSYLNDRNVNNLEKKLKDFIATKEIQNNFYYLNVTDQLLEEELYKDLNKKLDTDKDIKKLPVIIYYEEGKYKDIINSDTETFSVKEAKAFVNKHLKNLNN